MSDNDDTNIITVKIEEKALRIDKLLSRRYDNKSRSYFQYLIENDSVLLNGKKIKKRTIPKVDDEIEIFFILTKETPITAENIKLDIIYEDNDIIAINKPANMVVHPAPGHWSGTFVNALLYHCKNISIENDDLRPGIVHRLDKETSGILLAAKNKDSHRKLIEQFSSRKITKQYLAICLDTPKTKSINKPIGRHKVKRKEMTIREDGKEAITDIEVLNYKDNISLVLAKPKTGRTHQIRVHLKDIKTPVIGDKIYGNSTVNNKLKIDRHLLHAYKIKFIHPITNCSMELTAPIPSDFLKFAYLFDNIQI